VCDVTREWGGLAPFPCAALDIVTLIFVLSAIHPDRMPQVVANIYNHLRPGGQVFFRQGWTYKYEYLYMT
jgi:methyltransferase-like protein 6